MDAAEKQHCFLSVTVIESVCVCVCVCVPHSHTQARTSFKRRGMSGNTPHA